MAIVETREYVSLAMEEDPDDYRPDSQLAVIVDPTSSSDPFVEHLTVLAEKIAPGDRIPLHQHPVEEVLFVDEGRVAVRLGEEQQTVGAGAVVFIPAGTGHGFENVGDAVARIHAVFPSREVAIRYLERNPAPGTEGDDPQPPVAFDARRLVEGEPAGAIRAVRPDEFP